MRGQNELGVSASSGVMAAAPQREGERKEEKKKKKKGKRKKETQRSSSAAATTKTHPCVVNDENVGLGAARLQGVRHHLRRHFLATAVFVGVVALDLCGKVGILQQLCGRRPAARVHSQEARQDALQVWAVDAGQMPVVVAAFDLGHEALHAVGHERRAQRCHLIEDWR